jgi:hypothetical protein
MTVGQINKFIDEVKKSKTPVRKVMVIGGEPTIHPQFEEIMMMLHDELLKTGKIQMLKVSTNAMKEVPESVKRLPVDIITSYVKDKVHRCQFVAPRDTGQEQKVCEGPTACGIALNCYGYAPCGAGSAIMRLFDMKECFRYTLPAGAEDFGDLTGLCSLCQGSAKEPKIYGKDDCTPSRSFQEAIERYKKQKPDFRRY